MLRRKKCICWLCILLMIIILPINVEASEEIPTTEQELTTEESTETPSTDTELGDSDQKPTTETSEEATTAVSQEATTEISEETTTETQKPTTETQKNTKQTIFIIGDSTARSYESKNWPYPREGWGQEFVKYFEGANQRYIEYPEEYKGYSQVVRYVFPKFNIENWGKSKMTAKELYTSKRFQFIMNQVKKNDIILIQLGQNDGNHGYGESVAQYKKYLSYFIRKIQGKKASVTLVTPTPRNFINHKKISINVPAYRKAMLSLAKKYKIQCIDLDKECTEYFNLRGKKVSKTYYMYLKPKKYKNYPSGLNDATHFTRNGARVVSKVLAVQIQNNKKLKTLNKKLTVRTGSLYKTLCKANKYQKKRYTSKTWRAMAKERNRGWRVLYSPSSTYKDCVKVERNLKKKIKKLKRKR